MKDLKLQPNNLDPENLRDGYISVDRVSLAYFQPSFGIFNIKNYFQFYNYFHNGFCGPYIENPFYMLIIDFR